MSFLVTVNGILFDLGKEDGISTCISVGEKFGLSRKEISKLATSGKITTKDGVYIEVYEDV